MLHTYLLKLQHNITRMLHVWSIYLHLPYKSTIHVGKYIPYVDGMGLDIGTSKETSFTRNDIISMSCVLV